MQLEVGGSVSGCALPVLAGHISRRKEKKREKVGKKEERKGRKIKRN